MKTKAQFKSLKKRITEETAVNVGHYTVKEWETLLKLGWNK